MGSVIEVENVGRVRRITIDRPGQLNALNSEVLTALHDEIGGAAEDVSVGCIVIAGAGDRAFCAGADLDEIRGLGTDDAHAFIRRGQRVMATIEQSPVPVVAAVNGYALGGGFEMALACHLLLASESSSFGLPEAKIGCIPGFGGTQRLLSSTGKAAALYLMVSGDRITAERAWELGLLSQPPVASGQWEWAVAELADRISNGSRGATRNILESAHRAYAPADLEHEAALAAIAISSADGQEGITAFAEKRAPVFGRTAS